MDRFSNPTRHLTNKQGLVYIVACQGGGLSGKSHRHGADKTLALNRLVR